jgi:hypothetical protein
MMIGLNCFVHILVLLLEFKLIPNWFRRTCITNGKREVHTQFRIKHLGRIDSLEDKSLDGIIILKYIL